MSSGSELLSIMYFICVAINVFIFAPIIIYYCRKLWKQRRKPLLCKRYPKLAIIIILTAYIYTLIIRPIADLPHVIPSSVDYGPHTTLVRLLCYNSFHIFYTMVYYRTWLFFYDYSRGMHLVKAHWKSQINKEINEAHYWTLKYYKYFSPRSKYLWWISIAWILFVQLCIFTSYFGNAYHIVQPIFVLLFFIYSIILGINVRTCRDECFFLTEVTNLSIFGVLFVILYGLIGFAFSKDTVDDHKLKTLLTSIDTMVIIFLCSLIMTKWVLHQNAIKHHKIGKTHRTDKSIPSLIKIVSDSAIEILSPRNSSNTPRPVRFVDILGNRDGLDLFARHLAREFALENLLFLAETMQFKLEALDCGLIDEETMGVHLDFGTKIRKIKKGCVSKVVSDVDTFHANWKYICERYIVDGGEHCVNVSYATRAQIYDVLTKLKQIEKEQLPLANQCLMNDEKIEVPEEEYTKNELVEKCVSAMDHAMREIIALLSSDSFARFRATTAFKNVYGKPATVKRNGLTSPSVPQKTFF